MSKLKVGAMTLSQVLPEVERLSRTDKLLLIQHLAAEVMRSEGGEATVVPETCTVWSPYDAYSAAATLLEVLEEQAPA